MLWFVVVALHVLWCEAHHDSYKIKECFWDLHTIVASHNDSSGFPSTDPPIPTPVVGLRRLPGYGNIYNTTKPDESGKLVYSQRASFLVSSCQTRSCYPPQHHGLGLWDKPLRLPGDRRRLWRSGRGSTGGGARGEHRGHREPQTRRYLREYKLNPDPKRPGGAAWRGFITAC